jgi:GDP-6-deoxy-D-talose 4-dehydrogenase
MDAHFSRSSKPVALITGIRGFTGRYLADELRSMDYDVIGISHAPEVSDTCIYDIDLCDRSAVSRFIEIVEPTVVFHLAAISHVSHRDVDLIYNVNILGTRNLLEALASVPNKPDKIVLASSANIYGNADADLISESVSPNPANDYAVSKFAMEKMAQLWSDKLSIVITRPFNYTGVGQSEGFLIPKIVRQFQLRAPYIELGNLYVYRDFSDVRWVAKVYSQMIEVARPNEIYNICSGIGYGLYQIISMLEEIAGYQIEARVDSQFVRSNEVHRLVGDGKKLNQVIHDIPTLSFRSTLQWMYECGGAKSPI